MPSLADAVGSAYDTLTAPSASAGPDPVVTPEPEAAPLASDTPTTPDPNAAAPDPDPEAAPPPPAPAPDAVTPPPAEAAPVSVEDLKALKARFAADHPELVPVMDSFLKEAQRGLTKKFDAVAALRREAVAETIRDERLRAIPESDLVAMAQISQLAATNPQAAADYLFQVSEQLRQGAAQPQNPSHPDLAAALQQTPEWQQLRALTYQQQVQSITTQLDAQFAALAPEFGGQPIPDSQKAHVCEVAQQKGLGIEDVPLLWRALYGADFARAEGIRKGQALKQGKQGLAVTGSGAPAPAPAGGEKPKSLRDAVGALCDKAGIR